MNEADRIKELEKEVKRLRKLVHDAFCEGFYEGKNGTWIVGPEFHPWNKSDSKIELKEVGGNEN